MSQQSELAEQAYKLLKDMPLPVAFLISMIRTQWGEDHAVLNVHAFVAEVACCLLHLDGIEVGDSEDGQYVPWKIEPWNAHKRIERDLMSMDTFLEDEEHYVFRRK